MTSISDTEILRRLRADDKAAMQLLFERYYQIVCSKIYPFIKDRASVQDIAQDVFIKVWEKRGSIQIQSSLKGYLQRMAFNEAISYLRKHKKHIHEEEISPTLGIMTASSEQQLLDKELSKKITAAIDTLPNRCRLIFQMSRYEELTYKEIASKLDISVKTVENQMGKALRIIREQVRVYMKQ